MANNGSREQRQPTIRVEHAYDEAAGNRGGRIRPIALGFVEGAEQPGLSSSSNVNKTTTTTTTEVHSTTTREPSTDGRKPTEVKQQQQSRPASEQLMSVAVVEDLGKQAAMDSSISVVRQQQRRSRQSNHQSSRPRERSKSPPPPQTTATTTSVTEQQQREERPQQPTESTESSDQRTTRREQPIKSGNSLPASYGGERDEHVPGNKLVTTISTIATQSGRSRIVLALLKDGDSLQLKIQEMRPAILEVGANYGECIKYLEEHQKLMSNLRKQRKTPIDGWLDKYAQVSISHPTMSAQRKLVYLCMVENLQGCWKAMLNQLDQRSKLLDEASRFYESAEEVSRALDKADRHVQVFRSQFLAGPSSDRFREACDELERLNDRVLEQHVAARRQQEKLIDLVALVGTNNLGDLRVNRLVPDAQALMNYISTYLDPLERRRIQLESVLTTTTNTETIYRKHQEQLREQQQQLDRQTQITKTTTTTKANVHTDNQSLLTNNYSNYDEENNNSQLNKTGIVHQIGNFSDLDLAQDWLQVKIDQLNSSLLSSLGASVGDTRTILNKHEQIALECRAIEEATLHFNGRNIHAIRDPLEDKRNQREDGSLFAQQKLLAQRVRDVITILEVRIVLLRRTIDFYLRSKEATSDIGLMMCRLQVDNSLQSVQFVSNELELKDVSSVVASGATIISELQQLQLAQQHGQRSRLVNLNLLSNGIRAIIDQLNQDLAHLKTVLNQRRLVLLNEDATKMANNFSNKCNQLHFWLINHVKSFLLANNQIDLDSVQVRAYCDSHEQLRQAVQAKTPEVEALLRSLPILNENFDGKIGTADEIQRSTDDLREDWINTTNCLDRRIGIARKFWAILNTCSILTKELSLLDKVLGGVVDLIGSNQAGGRPTTPIDERTDSEIKANCDQLLKQLTSQVQLFDLDCRRANTELVYTPTVDGRPVLNDINKQLLVDHAYNLLKEFESKRQVFDDEDRLARVRQRRFATTAANKSNSTSSASLSKPAHQRAQLVDPPRFTRTLVPELTVEPFKTVELECETDQRCEVEWFLGNNFKRIPQTIKHQASSENNQHKLTISQFSPICCGQYVARATNSAGQAMSQCKLRLAGIMEADDAGSVGEQEQQYPTDNAARHAMVQGTTAAKATTITTTTTTTTQQQQVADQQNRNQNNFQNTSASPAAFSTTSSFSQWRPIAPASTGHQQPIGLQNGNITGNDIARIIRGVEEESSERGDSTTPSTRQRQLPTPPPQYQPAKHTVRITQVTSDDTITDGNKLLSPNTFPVTQTTTSSSGPSRSESSSRNSNLKVSTTTTKTNSNNTGRYYYTESPVSSTSFSRSASKSPMEGTPQPPVFVQTLTDSMPRSCSRAGLVCLVVGNPPPTIEWLHNNQTIATTKCPRTTPGAGCPRKGNVCKLTIETANHKAQGQYVCRASNRIGQTSTGITINK